MLSCHRVYFICIQNIYQVNVSNIYKQACHFLQEAMMRDTYCIYEGGVSTVTEDSPQGAKTSKREVKSNQR